MNIAICGLPIVVRVCLGTDGEWGEGRIDAKDRIPLKRASRQLLDL